MIRSGYRRSVVALAMGMLLLSGSSAWAINEIIARSCDPDCVTKPPKETLFIRGLGDFDVNGTQPEISGTLAKGKKKTVVKVDLTYEYFSGSSQFRQILVRINDKFGAPDFLVLSHIPQCGPGNCVVHTTWWFDIDGQESVYPGQFYGQPLKVDLEASTKLADANNQYNMTMAIQVIKKK